MKPIKFKLGIITQEVLGLCLGSLLMGCAASPKAPIQEVSSNPMIVPVKAHLAWCKNGPEECFEAAGEMCSPDNDLGVAISQHPKPGPWHQVAEQGMMFPAMIQDQDHSWRMLFVCNNEE